MTSTSSSDLSEHLSMEMENTVDSNSESDISDNWAVIDEDSSLEWNNEIKYEFRRPMHNFRNEQSDEESIEVVPEDSDAGFVHKYVEPDSDAILLPPMKEERSASKENIHTETSLPHVPGEVDQHTNDQKLLKQNHRILIGVITGVLALGCLWLLLADKFENSTPTSARVLVTKLQLENQYLRSQIRYVYTSLRSVVSKTSTTGRYNRTKEKLSNSSYSFPTSIFNLVLSTEENSPNDYCLISEVQHAENLDTKITSIGRRPTWTDKNDSSIQSRIKSETSFSNQQITESQEKLGQTMKEPTIHKNENKIHFEDKETNFELQNTIPKHHLVNLRIPVIDFRTSEIVDEDDGSMTGDESLLDPHPITKLRNSIEKIYALTPLFSGKSQVMLPSKSQLLKSLAQNVDILDSLLEDHGIDHNGISSFKMEIQNSTRMLADFVDQSINNLVENIAFKVQETQNKIQNQFCNFKTNFESENIALLNWQGKPIFQDCSKFKGSNIDEYMNEIKNIFSHSDKTSPGMKGTNLDEVHYLERDQPSMNSMAQDLHTNHDFKQWNEHLSDTKDADNQKGSFYTTSEYVDRENRKTPNMKTGNQNIHSEKDKGSFSKEYNKKEDLKVKKFKNSKSKQSNEEKKRKTNGNKFLPKKSKEKIIKDYTKYDKKKKTYKKEKYPAYNLNNEKKFIPDKRGSEKTYNVSGEWSIKLAHGREEQRRRNHESDWIFDRAQHRNSNREKSKKHKQEACWFYGKEYNQ